MRFVVDAQLPRALANHLVASGHDAIHVKQLPSAGDTTDAEISAFADLEVRIVITKAPTFRRAICSAERRSSCCGWRPATSGTPS
jgi:predicted nuclease of predicted toxin-antitoxin system